MAIDTIRPRSRRTILMGAVGGVVAAVATAVGRDNPVRATDGQYMHVGGTYTATTETTINATGASALSATSDDGQGVYGSSGSNTGVFAISDSGYGLEAYSNSNHGIRASSYLLSGIYGQTWALDQPAVVGAGLGGFTGVLGYCGDVVPPAPDTTVGVYGYSDFYTTSHGVLGRSPIGNGVSGIANSGHGVNGSATTGYGVFGAATSGIGMRGWSTTGTAGCFGTSGPKVGKALRAVGKVNLDNCAGLATITAGHNSVVVTPGTDLVATSAVVATLMGSAGGTTTVHRVVVNATADTFTIYLTANATAAVTVAWHVFG